MNIIKENLFFVVMGAVVLLALVLFLVLVQPLNSDNAELKSKVDQLVRELDDRVGQDVKAKGPREVKLPNLTEMARAQDYHDGYKREVDAVIDWLSRKRLSDTLAKLAPAERNAPGAYKQVYETSISELKKRLKDKFIAQTPDTWYFWNWGEGVPKEEDQRVMAAKEFNLACDLVGIISSGELHVMQLDRLEINPGETRDGNYKPPMAGGRTLLRVDPYFDVYPFVLEVRMPVERYEILLRELLLSSKDVPIYVRKVCMTRIEDDLRVTRQIPPLYIGIRVEGWALDYRFQEKRATSPTRFGGGGGAGQYSPR